MNVGGWEFLLPASPRRRWLHVDASHGATTLLLAPMCDELCVVPGSAEAEYRIVDVVGAEGVGNVKIARESALFARGEGAKSAFDGFILHDLEGVLSRRTVEQALRAAAWQVGAGGFVYVALRNRFGYTRLRRGWSEAMKGSGGAYFSWRSMRDLVARGRYVTLYPLICGEDGQVTDIVPPGGYKSDKNPTLWKEQLRRCLLGRQGAPRWSPGFAMVATGEPLVRSALQESLDTLTRHGCLEKPAALVRDLKRYHVVNGGKAILSIGSAQGTFGSHIVILVRSIEHVKRRRHEAKLLALLAQLPPDLSAKIPRFYYEEEVGGAHVFVLQEFPGITLDAPVPALYPATLEAARFLARLHLSTRHVVHLNESSFRECLSACIEIVRKRYPVLSDVVGGLENTLRKNLIGKDCPMVWMHGDFKIENVVVHERTGSLLGVIDWELSERQGLPLLDLWYLLLYNRQIERGEDFLTAVQSFLPPKELTSIETEVCNDYMRDLNIPARLVPCLVAALVLHHAGRRMAYDSDDTAAMQVLQCLLAGIQAWIGSEEASSSTLVPEAALGA